MKQRHALLSVFNKEGIVEFAQALLLLGFKLWSSGGTAKAIKLAGLEVTDVAELVGGKAILGHRVVTLSRELGAALLADETSPEDIAELVSLHIPFIDLVRCDFYPLSEAIHEANRMTSPTKAISTVVEKTDIGGPTMIREGAKGLRIVICRQQDMQPVLNELQETGDISNENRQKLRARAEFEVAKYVGDSAVFHGNGQFEVIAGECILTCKYGENAPQTPSTLFTTNTKDPLALDKFEMITGTAPSLINLTDLDRLLQTITHIAAAFDINRECVPRIAVGVKHGNACGAAVSADEEDVLMKMMAGDPLAIMGGLIIMNFHLTTSAAEVLAGNKFDGIIATSFDRKAIEILERKTGKCRFIANPALLHLDRNSLNTAKRVRQVRGGFLCQPNYTFVPNLNGDDIKKYNGHVATTTEDDMLLAWGVGSTSNSNTITLVRDGMLVGNGVGQQDRVGAAQLALMRATRSGHNGDRLIAYSDSFFPFDDGPRVLADAGIKAIFTSSGSINDKDTIALCEKRGIALYMIPDAIGRGFFGH